ncbi:MAG: hypothetical protein HYW06_10895 [Gemmatimonadetes bacterium]|nr:hypothetical protein [Gemmatimonadota bacterium]
MSRVTFFTYPAGTAEASAKDPAQFAKPMRALARPTRARFWRSALLTWPARVRASVNHCSATVNTSALVMRGPPSMVTSQNPSPRATTANPPHARTVA